MFLRILTPTSNQIRDVAFNVPQLTQASFLQKIKRCKMFFDICNAEMAQSLSSLQKSEFLKLIGPTPLNKCSLESSNPSSVKRRVGSTTNRLSKKYWKLLVKKCLLFIACRVSQWQYIQKGNNVCVRGRPKKPSTGFSRSRGRKSLIKFM